MIQTETTQGWHRFRAVFILDSAPDDPQEWRFWAPDLESAITYAWLALANKQSESFELFWVLEMQPEARFAQPTHIIPCLALPNLI